LDGEGHLCIASHVDGSVIECHGNSKMTDINTCKFRDVVGHPAVIGFLAHFSGNLRQELRDVSHCCPLDAVALMERDSDDIGKTSAKQK